MLPYQPHQHTTNFLNLTTDVIMQNQSCSSFINDLNTPILMGHNTSSIIFTRIQLLKDNIPINKYTLQRTIIMSNFPQQTAWSFNSAHIPHIPISVPVSRKCIHPFDQDALLSYTWQPILSWTQHWPCIHRMNDLQVNPKT